MADRPGDEAREIARELRTEADISARPGQRLRLTRLATRLDNYADSIDETIVVLTDPDAMAAIEDAEMSETVSSEQVAADLERRSKVEATPWEAPNPSALIEFRDIDAEAEQRDRDGIISPYDPPWSD